MGIAITGTLIKIDRAASKDTKQVPQSEGQ